MPRPCAVSVSAPHVVEEHQLLGIRLQVDLTAEILEPEPRDVVAEPRERTMKDQFSAMIDDRPVEFVLVPAG